MNQNEQTKNGLMQRIKRKMDHLSDKKILHENLELKNIHHGKSAFIIGNGPSIKSQDLIPLSSQWTFAANSFFRHEKFDQIHPKFYVIIDSEHFKGHEASLAFFKSLGEKIHKDTIVFLPLKAKRFMEKHGFLPNNKKYYIYVRGEFNEKKTNIEIDKTVPTTTGVGLMCLMIADYMGFDETFLLGFDHNWLAQRVEVPIERFYQKHGFSDEATDTYETRCWYQYVLFKNYRILKSLLKTKVFNLTPGTFLDVFPEKKYEQVLESKEILKKA